MSVDAIWAAAGTQVWQVTVAIVVVGAAVWAFCRRRPQVAYALWVVVLVKCVLPPVWSSSVGVFSWWDVHMQGDRPWLLDYWKEPMTVPVHEVREMVPGTNETRTVKFIIASEAVRAGISWREMCLLAWGLGAVVLGAVWWVRGERLLRRIEKSALEVPGEVAEMFADLRRRLGVREQVWLRVSKEAIGPGLFGVVRPIVVVPVAMLEEGANGRLRMVLAHELAHVRRKDHWVAGLQMVAQLGWWFHPLVWWMNQQVGRARELSCDEAVMAELGCAGEAYGQMLVDVLKMRRGMRMGAFAPGMRAVQVTARRLEHVMTQPARRRMPVWGWVVAGVMGMVLLPGAGVVLERGKARAAESGAATVPAASQPAKALTFQGIIVEKGTGKPIAGAKVTVHRVHPPGSKPDALKPVAPSEVITTDSAGRYSVYVPAEQAAVPDDWIATEVKADGYMSTWWDGWAIGLIERKNKEGDVTFGLKEEMYLAEEVHGVLQDAQGRALAHVPIKGTSRLIVDALSDCLEKTETDAEGRYTLKVIKGGELAEMIAYPKEGATITIDIGKKRGDLGVTAAKAGMRMKGMVLDLGGKPVAGATVSAMGYGEQNGMFYPSDSYLRQTKTDERGRFDFDPLEAGRYEIAASGYVEDDAGKIKKPDGFFVPVHVTLSAESAEVKIQALPKVHVHTQTVDPMGKAIKAVRVPVSGELDGNYVNGFQVEGDHGEGDIDLPKGAKKVQILMDMVSDGVSIPRYRRGENGKLQSDQIIELGTLNEDVTDIYIVRYRKAELTVRAVDEDGVAIKKILPHIEYGDQSIKMQKGPYSNGIIGVAMGELSAGGWHASELLPGEALRVSATAEGYEDAASEVMTLKEGEKKEVTLTLKQKGK